MASGTTSPGAKLTILSSGTLNSGGDISATDVAIYGPGYKFGDGSIYANLNLQSNAAAAIDVGGSLALGGRYNSAATTQADYGIIRGAKENSNNNDYAGYLSFGTRINGGVPTEKVRITSTGNVGIGTTSPTHLIHLNGGAYCDGTGDWIAGSDRAYKKEIDYDFKYGLKEIEQLKPVYYVHKQDKENKKQIGFIAQDMLEVIPEVVSGSDGALGLSYGQLTAVLVKAVQEQQKEIDELKQEISRLKGNL